MAQAFLASFSGTAVEFFETAVIAYAIVRAGYPREAIIAVVLGHVLVFALAVLLLPMQGMLPVFWLRLAAGLMLTLMGLHWTIKSLRRLWAQQRPRWAEDPLGKVNVVPLAAGAAVAFSPFVFLVMMKSSMVEAVEILVVVFPVAAATTDWGQVLFGVAAGIGLVSLLAFALHGQLRKVPEVKLKLASGLLLLALGLAWLAEMALERGVA